MHITIDEAIVILSDWKSNETPLDVHISSVGHGRNLQVTVIAITGTVARLSGNEGETNLDLAGATFNGDRRASPNSSYGPTLSASTETEISGRFMRHVLQALNRGYLRPNAEPGSPIIAA
jgi:hypothetical protein